ncbi:MAG: LamG domain-containing protein [Candidatus Woesearchaeota archaeon]|nr:LamG domain-containing protein [Candidatus Woesearchaeota archaeon]
MLLFLLLLGGTATTVEAEAIVEVVSATHIDEQGVLTDIFEDIRQKDDTWARVATNEYIRIQFATNLTATNDITVYARNPEGHDTYIEVYHENEKITEFPVITEGYSKVYLTNLQGAQDTFDLKVISNKQTFLEFDYITDPAPNITSLVMNSTTTANTSGENLTAYVNATAGADIMYDWRINNISTAVLLMNFDLNNSNGTGKVKDYSTFNNNGSVQGPVWNSTGGPNGTGAYLFDAGDYIDLAAPDDLPSGSDPRSMCAWAQADDIGGFRWIMSFGKATTGQAMAIGQSGGTAYGSGWGADLTHTNVFPVGVWAHICLTYDGTTATLYVNGTSVNSSTQSWNLVHDVAYVGRQVNSAEEWQGYIDDAAIFNRKLSAAQVLALYNGRPDLIVSQETAGEEMWSVCATPNDGVQEGTAVCSGEIEIINTPPTIDVIVVNSTWGANVSRENLTATGTTSDADGETAIVNYDWRLNDTSIAVLNMNFDINNSNGTDHVRDYSMHNNNGSVQGATWTKTGGYDGTGGYHFDGSAYIDLAAPSDLPSGTNPRSMCAWAKPDDLSGFSWVMSFGTASTGQAMAIGQSGGIAYGSGWGADLTHGGAFSVGVWTHVCLTYNGTYATLYLDGVNVTGSTMSWNLVHNVAYVGRQVNSAEGWEGYIDDVFIFNRSITDEQVAALYNDRPDLIVSQETQPGNNWSACGTPHDRIDEGNTLCSGGLEILINAPVTESAVTNVSSPVANATSVNISATITDDDVIDTVLIEITPPMSSAFNMTTTNSGDTFYNATLLDEFGLWFFRFFANDTEGNVGTRVAAQDQLGNLYVDVNTCATPSMDNNWTVNASDNCAKTNQVITLGSGSTTVYEDGYLHLTNSTMYVDMLVVETGMGTTRVIIEQGSKIVVS